MTQNAREQSIFLGLLLLIFAWAAFEANGFTGQARLYPFVVAVAALVIGLIEFALYAMKQRQHAPEQPAEETLIERFRKALPYLTWLVGLYATIYVIGMVVASGLFAALFLLREGKMRWYFALLSGLLVIVFLVIMQDVMSFKWPTSLIEPIEILGLD